MTCVEIRNRVNRARSKYPNCLKSDQNIPRFPMYIYIYRERVEKHPIAKYTVCIVENDHFLQTIIAKLQTPDPFNDLFDTFQRFLSSACYEEFERFEEKGLLVNHGAFRYNNGG